MELRSIASKKLVAAAVMAVLTLSILSLSIPALSKEQDSEKDEKGEKVSSKSEETKVVAASGVSMKIEVNDDVIKMKMEVKAEAGVSDGSYPIELTCKIKPEAIENPILSGTLVVEDGEGKGEMQTKLVSGKYADCSFTFDGKSMSVGGFSVTAEQKSEIQADNEDEDDNNEETDVDVTVVGNSSLAKVKVEFTSSHTDKESLLKEILNKVRLDKETVSNAIKMEGEGDEDEDQDEEVKEKLEVKAEIKDGEAKVEFEYRFVIESTEKDAVINAIVEKLRSLELTENDIKLKAEDNGEAKNEVKSEVKGEVKAKVAGEIAAKARAAAKGKVEVVENIDNAERYFGKTDKAVVGLKIGLESNDVESMSFGSAQLILVKIGDKEPMFRAVINVLTDKQVDSLTACLDGEPIGQLKVIHASEELGLTIGYLRESLSGTSITIPGVTVDIVNGTDCNSTPVLAGSI